jgi:N-methylhydantoinase A
MTNASKSTTAANAYVQPLVADYLDRLDHRVHTLAPAAPLRIMVSSGGFTSGKAAAETPILLLESGPTGGVLSALNTARNNGIAQILAFDLGGTTAKACVAVGGEPLIAHSFECARVSRFARGSGLPILMPSIDLIEIGAGGGSIAHVNELGLLNVGPESAGANPGPACYGQGGTRATVTDADLVLGYLNTENFLGGDMKLRKDLAQAALEGFAGELKLSAAEVSWGICNIVNENMAAAARIHIAEKGHDPREFTMVAAGGAGPVHVVEVARKLKIPRVLTTIAAGAGSCLGLLATPARVDRAWSNPALVKDVDWDRVTKVYAELRADAESELESARTRATGKNAALQWWLGAELRYAGQGHNVSVSLRWRQVTKDRAGTLLTEFEKRYRRLYGHLVPNAAPQVVTWRLTGRSLVRSHRFTWGDARASAKPVLRAPFAPSATPRTGRGAPRSLRAHHDHDREPARVRRLPIHRRHAVRAPARAERAVPDLGLRSDRRQRAVQRRGERAVRPTLRRLGADNADGARFRAHADHHPAGAGTSRYSRLARGVRRARDRSRVRRPQHVAAA